MAIIRFSTQDRFGRNAARIDQESLHDRRLSYNAKGIRDYVLGMPDHWVINVKQIAAANDQDSEHTVRLGLAELERCGYLSRWQPRDERGRLIRCDSWLKEHPMLPDPPLAPPRHSPPPARPEPELPETKCWFSPYGESESPETDLHTGDEVSDAVAQAESEGLGLAVTPLPIDPEATTASGFTASGFTASGFTVCGFTACGSTACGKMDPRSYLKKDLNLKDLKDPPLPPIGGEGDVKANVEAEETEVIDEIATVLPFPAVPEPKDEPETTPSLAIDNSLVDQQPQADQPDDFDTCFGDYYPQQRGMTAARNWWRKEQFSAETKEQIKAAVEAHLACDPEWKPNERGRVYLPAANRWLQEQCWRDRLPEPRLVSPSRSRPVCQHEGVDQHLTLGIWQCRDCPHVLTPQEVASRGLSLEPPGFEPLRQIQEQLARKGNA